MCGYYWQSGELAQLGSAPIPFGTRASPLNCLHHPALLALTSEVMGAAYHGYRVLTTATRFVPSPHRLAMTAVSEVGITAGQLIMQYRSAVAHIKVRSGQRAADSWR